MSAMFWCIAFLPFFYGQMDIQAFKKALENGIILYVKCLGQHLSHSKCLINVNCFYDFPFIGKSSLFKLIFSFK